MTTKPIILITTWKRPLPTFLGPATSLYTLGEEYAAAVTAAGGTPVLLPHLPDTEVDHLLALADGVLLSGGGDVHPASYGDSDGNDCHDVSHEADRSEIALVRAAARHGVPVLGICRGMQILNVALGGTLQREITRPGGLHEPLAADPDQVLGTRHPVHVIPHTRLERIIGTGSHAVNTIHHQAVDRLGTGLRVAATAPDGVVEAVETVGAWSALGVQWHPEKAAETSGHLLFQALVLQAARTYLAVRHHARRLEPGQRDR